MNLRARSTRDVWAHPISGKSASVERDGTIRGEQGDKVAKGGKDQTADATERRRWVCIDAATET